MVRLKRWKRPRYFLERPPNFMDYINELRELESYKKTLKTSKDNWVLVFEKGDLLTHLTYSIDYHTFLINVYKITYKGLRHLERKYLDTSNQVNQLLNTFQID